MLCTYFTSYRVVSLRAAWHTHYYTQSIYGAYLTDTNSENRTVRPGNTWHDGPDLSENELCWHAIAVMTVEPAGKASFVYSSMVTRLMCQHNRE